MGCVSDLESRMQKADYEWEWSDSIHVRRRGAIERTELIKSLRELPHGIALQLIDQHVPTEYKPLFADLITEAK